MSEALDCIIPTASSQNIKFNSEISSNVVVMEDAELVENGHDRKTAERSSNGKKSTHDIIESKVKKNKIKVKHNTKAENNKQRDISEIRKSEAIWEEDGENNKDASSENEQDHEQTVKEASSRSTTKKLQKSLDLNTDDDEQQLKPKRKSKLSLNSEVKIKNKFKEDNNQGTITSFFQKMSPKIQDSSKNTQKVDKIHVSDAERKSNGALEVKENSENILIKVNGVKEAKNLITNANGVDEENEGHHDLVQNKSEVKENSTKINNHVSNNDASSKTSRTKKKSFESVEGESKSSKRDRKKKNSEAKHSHKETAKKKVDTESSKNNENKKLKDKNDRKKKNAEAKHSHKETAKKKEDIESSKNNENKKLEDKNDRKKKNFEGKHSHKETTNKNDRKKKNSEAKHFHKETSKRKEDTESSKNNENKKLEEKATSYSNEIEELAESTNGKSKVNEQKENENDDENQKENLNGKEHKKVRFSEDIKEFSPEPVRRNSKFHENGPEELKNDENEKLTDNNEKKNEVLETVAFEIEIIEDEDKKINKEEEESSKSLEEIEVSNVESSKNKIRNAFTFMMDSRHKSIGQNSPGKEAEKSGESPELHKESKKKLSTRRAIFEDWANAKGAKKRKIEDEEKGVTIENKLRKRAKRLKKMLTVKQSSEKHSLEKQSLETLDLDENSEGKSEIVMKKHKVTRIIQSDSECTGDSGEIEKPKDTKDEIKACPEKVDNKRGQKRKRKLESEEKILQNDDVAPEDDDALDEEMFLKHKKPKLLLSSDSSNSGSNVISEDNLKNNSKRSSSSTSLQQMELSSFFGILNKTEKSKTTTNKNKSKLQMKRNVNNFEENSKTRKNKQRKNQVKSKLTLKKNEDSNGTITSDDFSNSLTTESQQKTQNDLETETTKSNTTEMDIEKESQAVLTPRSIKQWKMRLRVCLADADDKEIEKLVQPHIIQTTKPKDDPDEPEDDPDKLEDDSDKPEDDPDKPEDDPDKSKVHKTKKKIKKFIVNLNSDADDELLSSKKTTKPKDDPDEPEDDPDKPEDDPDELEDDPDKPEDDPDKSKVRKTKKKIKKFIVNLNSDADDEHLSSKKTTKPKDDPDEPEDDLVEPEDDPDKSKVHKTKKKIKKFIVNLDSDTDDEPLSSKKTTKPTDDPDKPEDDPDKSKVRKIKKKIKKFIVNLNSDTDDEPLSSKKTTKPKDDPDEPEDDSDKSEVHKTKKKIMKFIVNLDSDADDEPLSSKKTTKPKDDPDEPEDDPDKPEDDPDKSKVRKIKKKIKKFIVNLDSDADDEPLSSKKTTKPKDDPDEPEDDPDNPEDDPDKPEDDPDKSKVRKTKKKIKKFIVSSDSDSDDVPLSSKKTTKPKNDPDEPEDDPDKPEDDPDKSKVRKTKKKIKKFIVNLDSDADDEPLLSKKTTKSKDDPDESEDDPDKSKVRKTKKKIKKFIVSSDSDSDDVPLSSKKYHKVKLTKDKSNKNVKPVKLAPLFIMAKPKPKPPKLDEATIEARRKFLHSGIPDSLKKTIEKQQRVEELEYEIFPTVSHVTIKPTNEQLTNSHINFWTLPKADLRLTSREPYSPKICSLNLGSVTSSTVLNNTEVELQALQKITNIKNHLKQIKSENPNYPVYKAFKHLHQKHFKNSSNEQKIPEIAKLETVNQKPKAKRGRPKKKKPKTPLDDDVQVVETPPTQQPINISTQEIWTDLYKPGTSEEIFGNHASILQLKTWLETWLEFSEEINMQRKRKRRNSDSSDFESTDADSKDTRFPGKTFILCGPHGSGKTTAVYALCNELSINVLELNASSKRTGKRLLQELQEATQSHQVRKNDLNPLTTFLKKEETKILSQNSQSSDSQSSSSSQKMCLLLIEDVDIVFEQDENFITALGQLLTSSKRPVVLTTTDTNCLHLKKFFAQHSIISFSALSTKILAVWLQVLCLIEGLHVDRQTVVELLERNKGDIRRTLLELQFWVQSGGQSKKSQEGFTLMLNTSDDENLGKDDNSNMSWFNDETQANTESTNANVVHRNCLESFGFCRKFNNSFTLLPLDLGDVWWNLSNLLKIPPPTHKNKLVIKDVQNETEKKDVEEEKPTRSDADSQTSTKQAVDKTDSKNFQNILNIFETLALTDTMYEKLNIDCDLEPVHKNKDNKLKDGIELSESMENYCSSRELTYEWSHTLLNGYMNYCDVDERNNSHEDYSNYSVVEEKRWRTKQNKCDETLLDAVPVVCHLDRSSVNMDYLSTLRTMARSEVIRASNNHKRGNRFYNYLRGIGISCNDSLFQTACNAFQHEN